MINLIRKNQQVLMVLITVLVIVAFVWLYNGVRWEKMGTDRVGRIYNHVVSLPEFESAGRKFELARDLALSEFLQTLAAVGGNPGAENFVWNLMVLQHESRELQIRPTDDQVAEEIQDLPVFQTNGKFNPQSYALFVDRALAPRGFTQRQLEELIRDELRLKSVRSLVGSTVTVSAGELRDLYQRRSGRLEAAVIRFNLDDFKKEISPSEEEILKAYGLRKDAYTTEEKRKVKVATFALPKDAAATKDRERVKALQALADKANDFTQKLLEPGADFDAIAKNLGIAVKETDPFVRNAPPAALAQNPQLAAAAFELTKEQPVTDVMQAGDAFYVIQLVDIVPKRPLTFDEAKAQVAEQLKTERATEKMNLKAAEVRKLLTEALKEGKPFAEAASEVGVKAEDFPEFSLAEPKFDVPDGPAVMQTAITMKKDDLSQPVPTASGAVLVFLKDRLPIDEAKFAAEMGQLRERLASSIQQVAFAEWLRLRRLAADVQYFGGKR